MFALDRVQESERVRYIELRTGAALESSNAPFRFNHNYCFHKLDLRPDLNALFNGFHKDSIQRKIRRAEREGLLCEEGRSPTLLEHFWNLFLLTRRRHQAPPPPKRWFQNVLDCLGEAVIVRVAFNGAQPVAAVMTLCHRDTLVYKYGCSDPRFHNLGGMPYLFWKSIQDAKRNGLTAFDLGRTDLDNPGLITFKDRFGAARSVLTYARFSAAGRRPSDDAGLGWASRAARAVVAHLPDRMFSAVGSILYKHFG